MTSRDATTIKDYQDYKITIEKVCIVKSGMCGTLKPNKAIWT
jgi:hypothetical protein